MNIFRELDSTELNKFEQWARDNYEVGTPISEIWHPSIQAECQVMNEEAEAKAKADRERIKEVVLSVDDAQKEFEGTIILHVGFQGSLAKSKALTKTEVAMLQDFGGDEKMLKTLKHSKPLFENEEYDAIETFKSKRRAEFANLGIPFPLGDSMYLIRITNIPKAEELATKTEQELKGLVKALEGTYSASIAPEAVKLGPLYNAGDYKSPEALVGLFKFKSKWMHFGVPEVLKEIDAALWEKERERTAAVWQEAKEQGLMLLRQSTAEMVTRLVDAVTPDAEGNKKRFFATSVTNIEEFLNTFQDRNLANDTALMAEVEKLKKLIEGKSIEAFKTDEALRETVRKSGAEIGKSLESMLLPSNARIIELED